MSKKPTDRPPPKQSAEEKAFHDLLKKLVQVPHEEIEALRAERQKKRSSPESVTGPGFMRLDARTGARPSPSEP